MLKRRKSLFKIGDESESYPAFLAVGMAVDPAKPPASAVVTQINTISWRFPWNPVIPRRKGRELKPG